MVNSLCVFAVALEEARCSAVLPTQETVPLAPGPAAHTTTATKRTNILRYRPKFSLLSIDAVDESCTTFSCKHSKVVGQPGWKWIARCVLPLLLQYNTDTHRLTQTTQSPTHAHTKAQHNQHTGTNSSHTRHTVPSTPKGPAEPGRRALWTPKPHL